MKIRTLCVGLLLITSSFAAFAMDTLNDFRSPRSSDLSTSQPNNINEWMHYYGVIEKCEDVHLYKSFQELSGVSIQKLNSVTNWMIKSGAWDKCQDGFQIYAVIISLIFRSDAEHYSIYNRINELEIILKCEHGRQISKIINQLPLYSTTEHDWWIKESGIIEKCEDGNQISKVIALLSSPSPETLKLITNWVKATEAKQECDDEDLFPLMKLILKLLRKRVKKNVIIAILGTDPLPVEDYHYAVLYALSMGSIYDTNNRMEKALETIIQNPLLAQKALVTMVKVLGENHDLVQKMILLGLSLAQIGDTNSSFAVHRERLLKSEESFTHNPLPAQSFQVQCTLNPALLQKPRPAVSIHLPLNVWERWFDVLEQLSEKDVAEICGDSVSKKSLMKSRGDVELTRLLDPRGSLCVPKGAQLSTHSMMLRTVMKRIDDDGRGENNSTAITSFIQLLANIKTCTTGKMNGIAHSFRFLNGSKILDETTIGKETFQEEVSAFFEDELRRFREATLTQIVLCLTGKTDPHDINYVRGCIGRDIGVLFNDEELPFDLYGRVVHSALREASKQKLLDTFYKYYSTDEVINRVHYLLNNGSLACHGLENQASIVGIARKLFEDRLSDLYDEDYRLKAEYITHDDQGNPTGFTPLMASLALSRLGFLVKY